MKEITFFANQELKSGRSFVGQTFYAEDTCFEEVKKDFLSMECTKKKVLSFSKDDKNIGSICLYRNESFNIFGFKDIPSNLSNIDKALDWCYKKYVNA